VPTEASSNAPRSYWAEAPYKLSNRLCSRSIQSSVEKNISKKGAQRSGEICVISQLDRVSL
jgi:hypothetical protein